MKRRNLLVLGVGTAGAMVAGRTAAFAQDKMVLKSTDVHPLGYPTVEAVVRMGKKLEGETNGRITVQMFPSGQLGGEKEMIEQAQVGALQMARISTGPVGPVVDELNVFNLPFVFRDEAHMRKVIDGDIGRELLEKVSANPRTNLIGLCWMDAGSRNVYTKKPIRKPEDLAGMRIRTPPAPIWQESVRALGATPVAMAYGEMYTGMQSKAIDGMELSATATFNAKMHEVAKYLSETRHILLINFEVISSKWFNSLPAEYQKILEEECDKAGLEVSRSYLNVLDIENTKNLQAKGVTIVPQSEVNIAAFKEAGEKAYQKLNLVAARDKIYQELGKKK